MVHWLLSLDWSLMVKVSVWGINRGSFSIWIQVRGVLHRSTSRWIWVEGLKRLRLGEHIDILNEVVIVENKLAQVKILLSWSILRRLVIILVELWLLQLLISVSIVKIYFILLILMRVHVSISTPHSIDIWFACNFTYLGVLVIFIVIIVHFQLITLLYWTWHFSRVIWSSILNKFMTKLDSFNWAFFEIIVSILIRVCFIWVSNTY